MTPYFASACSIEKLTDCLEDWMETPYRHLCMVKHRGVDCSLFIGAVLKELGLLQEVVHDWYSKDWFIHSHEEKIMDGFVDHLLEHMADNYSMISLPVSTEWLTGDMFGFTTIGTGVVNHTGFYVGNKKMVHSIETRGVSDMLLGNWWRKRMRVMYRIMVN